MYMLGKIHLVAIDDPFFYRSKERLFPRSAYKPVRPAALITPVLAKVGNAF